MNLDNCHLMDSSLKDFLWDIIRKVELKSQQYESFNGSKLFNILRQRREFLEIQLDQI